MKRYLAAILAFLLLFPHSATAQETDSPLPAKQETVYVDTDATGAPSRVLVSVYLSNAEGEKSILDQSNLENITALGNQSYNQQENQLEWDTGGDGVYYQGESAADLPVTMTIAYTLDGEEILPEALAGKSGHLRMVFTYENHIYGEYAILDKTARIYTPFAVLTMLTLDTEKCKNIHATDARMLQQDGSDTIVGICFPGLSGSLDMGTDIIDLPGSFSIEADVTDFRMDGATTLVAANLLSEEDITEPESVQELLDDLQELSDGSDDLVEGTQELSDGVGEMGDGIGDLLDAHKEIRDALKKLANGMGDLSDGAEELRKGTNELKKGMDTVAEGASALSEGISALRDNTKKLSKAAKSMADAMEGAGGGSSIEGLSDLKKLVKSNKKLISSLSDAGDESPALEALSATNKALDGLIKAVEKASSGNDISELTKAANTIADGLSQLVDAQKEMTNGASALSEGAKSAASGAKGLASGAKSLKGGIDSAASGTKELRKGADKLVDGGKDLSEGYDELKDGVEELKDGVKEFDEDGIKKLVDKANDGVEEMRLRRAALVERSESYTTFSGLPEGREGSVTFLYKSTAIEKQRSANMDVIEEIAAEENEQEEQNLWQRFTGWVSGLFGNDE